MALYQYQAFTKEGKRVAGTLDAPSLVGAREQLVKMGVYPIAVALAKAEGAGLVDALLSLFRRKVTTKDKILFTKQLSVLLKAGVPLLEGLELLADQFEGRVRSMLIAIKDGVREGQSFADGLGKYPSVFDNIYVQLVRAGEATGKLELILDRLTTYLERQETLRQRVRAAMTYPIIQLVVAGAVVIFLMVGVVPTLMSQFKKAGQDLPGSTQVLLGMSTLIKDYFILLVLGGVLCAALFRYWRRTPYGGKMVDTIKLKIPFISFFSRTGAIIQFTRTLGVLLEGGVNLAQALDIVCRIIDNQILAHTLFEARENIVKQGKIAHFLKQTKIFPPIAIHLIKTGEDSGNLDGMLQTVAQQYETELNEYADTLSTLIGPIMLVVMGVIVGFIVVSIMQPLLQQAKLAGGVRF